MEDTNAPVRVVPEAEPVEPNDAASPAEAPAEAPDVAGAEQRLLGAIAGRRQLAAHVYGRYGWQLATPGDAGPAQLFGQAQPLIVAAPRIPARSPFMSVVGAAEQMVRTDSQGMAGAHERVDGTWAPEELFWWHRLSPSARMLGQRYGAPPPVRAHVPPPEPPEHPIVRGDPVPAPPPITPGAPAMPLAPRSSIDQEPSTAGESPAATTDSAEPVASAMPDVIAAPTNAVDSAAPLETPHAEAASSGLPEVLLDAPTVTAEAPDAPAAAGTSERAMASDVLSPEAAAPSDSIPAPAPRPSVVSTVVAAATSLWQQLHFVTPPANRRTSERPNSPLAAQVSASLERPAVPASPHAAVIAGTQVSSEAATLQVVPRADAARERAEALSESPPLASTVVAPLASSERTGLPRPTGVPSPSDEMAAPLQPLEPRSPEQLPVESTIESAAVAVPASADVSSVEAAFTEPNAAIDDQLAVVAEDVEAPAAAPELVMAPPRRAEGQRTEPFTSEPSPPVATTTAPATVARQAAAPEETPRGAMAAALLPEPGALIKPEAEIRLPDEESVPSSAERLVVTPHEVSIDLPEFTHAPVRASAAAESGVSVSGTDVVRPPVGETARPATAPDTAAIAAAAGPVAASAPEVVASLRPVASADDVPAVTAALMPEHSPGAAAQPEAMQPVRPDLPSQPSEPDAQPSTPVLVALRDALGAAWRQVQLVVAPPSGRGRRVAPAAQDVPAAREISAAPPATAARATAPGTPTSAVATVPVPVPATTAVVSGAGTVGTAPSTPAPRTPPVLQDSPSPGATSAPAPTTEPMSTASRWRSVPGDFTPPAELVAPLAAMLARQHTASDSDEWGSIPTVGYVVRRAPTSPDERASEAHGASLPGSVGPKTAHDTEAPSFGELPAQLETLGDEDLARLIMSLPPAMASRAISAGLLDAPEASMAPILPELTLSPAARPSSRAQEGPLWGEPAASRAPSTRLGAERVFAPALARRGSPADQRAGAAGAVTFGSDGSMSTGASGVGAGGDGDAGGGTRQPVASGMSGASATGAVPGISRAPLDRAASSDGSDSTDGPGGAMTAPDETPADEEPAEEPNLDRLAEEVFDILRWRLVSERERAFR